MRLKLFNYYKNLSLNEAIDIAQNRPLCRDWCLCLTLRTLSRAWQKRKDNTAWSDVINWWWITLPVLTLLLAETWEGLHHWLPLAARQESQMRNTARQCHTASLPADMPEDGPTAQPHNHPLYCHIFKIASWQNRQQSYALHTSTKMVSTLSMAKKFQNCCRTIKTFP